MEASRKAMEEFLALGRKAVWLDPNVTAVDAARYERGHDRPR